MTPLSEGEPLEAESLEAMPSEGEPSEADPLQGFRRLGGRPRFEGRLFAVETVAYADPDGHEITRDVVRHPGAVSVVAAHGDGTVTLVRQVRVAVAAAVLEAPAGTRDVDGEPPEVTARRELEEEAGLRAARLERLGSVYNSPGYTDQRTILYLATDLTPGETQPSGAEERWMTTERIALCDVERLVADGRLLDATTIAGLLLARHALGHGKPVQEGSAVSVQEAPR
ncbi:MAG: NUDIX hydrolase [Actinomycetota bacterium]|nr:NUDIX hydrolase [Actinomycetota bacterium]